MSIKVRVNIRCGIVASVWLLIVSRFHDLVVDPLNPTQQNLLNTSKPT